jgi:hypothetical protein
MSRAALVLSFAVLTILVLAILAPSRSEAAPGEKRVALVIGNSAYAHVPALPNPKNDAKGLAIALNRLGFSEVIERVDLTQAQLLAELRAFGATATGADWAVIFYAGHGMQVDGQNYLIPVDARLARASDIEEEAVPLERALSKVREAKKLRLVILDACRDNPFAARMAQASRKRSLGRGLARIEPDSGELIAFAARDGQQADDGPEGHSPFTAGLLAHIEQPGIEVNLLFRKVRGAVMASTNNSQEPFIYGSLPEEQFFFSPPKEKQGAMSGAKPEDGAAQEWAAVDKNSVAMLETFLARHGASSYADYARGRIVELKQQQTTLTPPIQHQQPQAGASESGRSYWNHNGSTVYLTAEGQKRRFYYETPRQGIQDVGASRGTMLFDGVRSAGEYSGTAWVFTKKCGPLSYAAEGPVSSDDRKVTLHGKAPNKFSDDCTVIGHRDDVLVFELIAPPDDKYSGK